MSKKVGRNILLAALASGTLLIAGCATETTYRPATGHGFSRQGYSDRQIEPNRFLITFSGNSVTSRDTVERYLFFRAAELTLQQGFDYFELAQRDTDLQSRTYSTGFGSGYGYGGFGGFWGPSWRFHGRGGWRGGYGGYGGYSGFGGYGGFGFGNGFFGNDFDVQTIDRYEATAEIVMRKGPPPRGNVRVFDARAVTAKVGPTVVLPKQQ